LLFRKLKHHNNSDQDNPGKELLKHQNFPLLKGAGRHFLLRKEHHHSAEDDLGKHLNLSLSTIFYHMVMSKQQHNKAVRVQNLSLLESDEAGRDLSLQNLALPTIFYHMVMRSNLLKMSPWNVSALHW
jgi:hypothetical protein